MQTLVIYPAAFSSWRCIRTRSAKVSLLSRSRNLSTENAKGVSRSEYGVRFTFPNSIDSRENSIGFSCCSELRVELVPEVGWMDRRCRIHQE